MTAKNQGLLSVWTHSFCPEKLSSKEVTSCLRNAQIEVKPFHPESPIGPGIIVLSEITEQISAFVRTLSEAKSERILVLTPDQASLATANPWEILAAGASDFVVWGQLADPGSVIRAKLLRWQGVDESLNSSLVRNNLVGQSRAWRSSLRLLLEVARFTDDPILLMGETGTGKELAARLIHTLDPKRSEHDLVILDCTTIVPELSGSELFGHEKGAFTGAISTRDGAFALANGGTLFLDEVGELPPSLQVQLLRVLQEHTYKRVGSNIWQHTDFRLISATNRDISKDQATGQFRKDLYYRIATWALRMPPLRERVEDIPLLIQHFINQARPNQGLPEVDEKIQQYFLRREYPGNVRDLRNLVLRIMARYVGPGPITVGDIPPDERPSDRLHARPDLQIEQSIRSALASGLGLREIRKIVEETTIRIVLESEGGNLQRAAKVLDVTDRTLQKRRADQVRQLESLANPSGRAPNSKAPMSQTVSR